MQTTFSRIRIRSFFLQQCIPAFHKKFRMQVKCKPPFPELQLVHFFYNDVSLPFIKELGCK